MVYIEVIQRLMRQRIVRPFDYNAAEAHFDVTSDICSA